MMEPMDEENREELSRLYAELHLACGRAAAALRYADNPGASEHDLLSRFRTEEQTAARIWAEITSIRSSLNAERPIKHS
jgi:hypothetical protein